jgi:hypothetical protein
VILIDELPDDVLLAIFDFCVDKFQSTKRQIQAWHPLVHVCQRWRGVVFGSPHRLNLRLFCTSRTPVRDTLDVWPPLPLVIQSTRIDCVDNVVAVLECRDRVDKIELDRVNSSPLGIFLAEMLEPFPELTCLRLLSRDKSVPVVPDSFLGGHAPRLQVFTLYGIPFPGLPRLLLSATHLVNLHLSNVPHSGYISPDAMANTLSTLTSLESLSLEFQSPRPHPDPASRRPPPTKRTTLPILSHFSFKGVCEYLEVLVARIDAPRVSLSITFFNQIVFDTPQFTQFITRTPTLKALQDARVVFRDDAATVKFSSRTSGYGSVEAKLEVLISCRELDWQVSSLEQVCTLLPPLSTSEEFYVYRHPFSNPHRQDNIEDSLWLELLHPFMAVKNLYLCKEFAPRIVFALGELVGGGTTEVLPALQNIFLEEVQPSGPVQEGVGKLIAARELSGHPITVSFWERDLGRAWA